MDDVSRGLKPSKKFANGSVHENGTGKFEILERFLENNIIMLKFKWLTGEFEGQTEVNKEVNINASIWKFNKVRGRVGNNLKLEPSKIEDILSEIEGKVDEMYELQHESRGERESFRDWQVDMTKKFDSQHEEIIRIGNIFEKFLQDRNGMIKRAEELEVKVEKLTEHVADKNRTIDRLVTISEANQIHISSLVANLNIASQLIERLPK